MIKDSLSIRNSFVLQVQCKQVLMKHEVKRETQNKSLFLCNLLHVLDSVKGKVNSFYSRLISLMVL